MMARKKLSYKTIEKIWTKKYRGINTGLASIYINHFTDGTVSYTFNKHIPDTKTTQKTFKDKGSAKAYAKWHGFDY